MDTDEEDYIDKMRDRRWKRADEMWLTDEIEKWG